MALIDLIEVSKAYETKKILTNVNFSLQEGERVVIVGKNGSGKSTLMRLITGKEQLDEGRIITNNSILIEMLDQQPEFKANQSVKESIQSQLIELNHKREEYDRISMLVAEDFENEALLHEQADLAAYLDFHDGWDLDNKIERIMQEFKLKEYEDKDVNLLSGGEQRRVALASLLLKKPDLLLLDEPTNHLDVYMVEFLEELLTNSNYTILLISHDRYFIDKIATRTIEIDTGEITSFSGGYTNYLKQKELMLEQKQKEHENLLRHLRQEEHWLQRGVTARRKRNERRKAELMELRKEAKSNPSVINKIKLQLQREQLNFNKSEKQSKKKMFYDLEKVTLQMGDKLLFRDFTARILQRDKIAIVGPNGTGKSTLLKLLLGRLEQKSGTIKRGDFSIGYFDQQRAMLDNDKNLIETFCPNGGDRIDVQGSNMHVYGYLKNFLFPKEFLDKKIGVLSGGEKNRVALALLFTKKVDCLILDEPTNDLDIPTINIIEENLQKFGGAVIFVSHDRYFVDKIASKLFIIKNQEVQESYQLYSEYLEIERELEEIDSFEVELKAQASKPIETSQPKKKVKLSFNEQREYDSLPEEIEIYEHQIEKLQTCLSDPNCYEKDGVVKLSSQLEELKEQYEQKVERFLELEELVESLTQS
jgi:ATP-binding cassette subfamily F protein uup